MTQEYKNTLINIGYRFAKAFNVQNYDLIEFDNYPELIDLLNLKNREASEILKKFYDSLCDTYNEYYRTDFTKINCLNWLLKQQELMLIQKNAFEKLIEFSKANKINLDNLISN